MKIDLTVEELTTLSIILRGFKSNGLSFVLSASQLDFVDRLLFDIDLILSS